MEQGQASDPTPDAARFYAFCKAEVTAKLNGLPALSTLETAQALWLVAVNYAHALETAGRGFGSLGPSDPHQRVHWVAMLLLGNQTPTCLYALWYAWATQHPDWPEADTLQVPVYFLLCRTNLFEGLRVLARRSRGHHLPVFKAWAGLKAGPGPDEDRLHRLLGSMDRTLLDTVGRRLERARHEGHEEDLSAMMDADSVAVEGAVKKKHHAEASIIELFRRGGSITMVTGESIEIPTIPEVPIRGMEGAIGPDAVWRDAAKEAAIKLLSQLAPGILGILETTLSDAAKAEQRRERERMDAKERGGSGGEKANKARTAEPPAKHVLIDDLDNGRITLLRRPGVRRQSWLDPEAEALAGKRPNPQEQAEAHEEEIKAKKDAEQALRIALDHWGSSGQRMLEALAAGETDKAAATAAGISAPALIKRRKTLQKKLLKGADPRRPLT